MRLYRHHFDDEIDYSDYGHARAVVIGTIENALVELSDLWVDEDGIEAVASSEPSETPRRMRANLTYYALRNSGWLEEERRGYVDYVNMPPRVNQCLAMLVELAEGRPLVMTGKLKTLEAGMRQVLDKPDEQADSLTELAKEAGRFARHMNSIRGAIKGLYDQIKGNLATRDILSTFFDDFLAEIFIRDYATIKTSENPLRIRNELLRIVSTLRYTAGIRSQLLEGYQRIYGHKGEDVAELRLDQDLSRLEQVFSNIERQLEALDEMKVRYERRIDTVIDYATRAPRTLSRDLKRLASAIARHADSVGDDAAIPIALPLTHLELVGYDRMAQPKRRRTAPQPRTVKKNEVSEQARARSNRERAARRAFQVDDEALTGFLDARMRVAEPEKASKLQIRTVRDYFCVIALRRAAIAPSAYKNKYPDVLDRYKIAPSDEWVETEFFNMRDIVITRRD
ncbi:hypothetical protein TspCOW1_13040 [Thiohalobacter sp. COW1]|nr:hypothetical protein TspCOW1_13040 [Thiohalobacter sp. COW1]